MILKLLQKLKTVSKRSTALWDAYYNVKFFIELCRAFLFRRKVVISRSACLGQELIQILYPEKNVFVISEQKMRFDLFLDQFKIKNTIRGHIVREHLVKEKEIFLYPFIQEQRYRHWFYATNIDFFMIDSFAELVDQRFIYRKEGWSFCSYGSDVQHTKEFNEDFDSLGLLKIEALDSTYRAFFDWFESEYKGKQVFFFHYPTTLDSRPLYIERAAAILDIMKKLEREKSYIHNIHVDPSVINWTEDDEKHEFPYHYSKKTVEEFARRWKEVGKKINFELA